MAREMKLPRRRPLGMVGDGLQGYPASLLEIQRLAGVVTSIRRKLDGGSDAVTEKDFAARQLELREAQAVLHDLLADDLATCGLTLQDLIAVKRAAATADTLSKSTNLPPTRAASRNPSPAKYRDPKTGATWSGTGRAPTWIATAKSRDKFLIPQAG